MFSRNEANRGTLRAHPSRAADPEPLMTIEQKPAPACAYLLADHLDAVLAAGEDLLGLAYHAAGGDVDPLAAAYAQRMVVERIRGLEAVILARTLKARERGQELAGLDARFAPVVGLFVGGTAALVDAIEESADATDIDFEGGDGILAFLRGRGLVDPEATHFADDGEIAVGDSLLLMRRVPLGALLDLVAAFLDTLDVHFELYGDLGEGADGGSSEAA
jgi:hypothetical protein